MLQRDRSKGQNTVTNADRRWFEQTVDGLTTHVDQQSSPPLKSEPQREGDSLTRAEVELQAMTADAPEAVRKALADEVAYQRRLAAAADERAQRLDLLHQRLEPDQRAALERYLAQQGVHLQDYPQPEPGPDGEPMLPSSLDRARQRMVEDYEREEPER